jgi:peptidyl-prolyl cis-trans isomerase D
MLGFMRKHAGSWVVRIALGLITLVFIFFMGGGGRLSSGQAALAKVGGETITAADFEQAWHRNEAFYREQYGDKLNAELLRALDIPSMTLNQLVDSAVLRGEAERIGLRVPDDAVRDKIRGLDAFQREGEFSPAIYRASLARRGMSATSFEEGLRRDILAQQLVDVIRRGVHVTEDEALAQWIDSAEKIVLSYVAIPTGDLESQVAVDEEALTRYFDDHAEAYRQPEAVRVRYLPYSPQSFSEGATVSDEAIEEYYVLHEDDFKHPETVSARHILKKVDPDAGDDVKAAARAAIENVKKRLDAGEDFAKVAEEESEDPGSASHGGDLGAFKRGAMVKPFEDAAFSLEVGQTSDIVETPFGFHIIRVYDHQPAGTQPLDDVRAEITDKLKDKAAADRAFDLAASDALELREGRSDFNKVASERGLEVKTTDMISKGAVVPDVGSDPAFVNTALGLASEGATSDPVHVGSSYYVLQLVERRASHVPEMSEARDKVERDYRRDQAAELAQKKASELIAQLEAGKSLDDLAAEQSLEVKETEPFTRRSGIVAGLSDVRGLPEVAFSTHKDGDVLPRPFSGAGQAYVFVRKSLVEPDRSEFDSSKDQILEAVRQKKERDAVDEFLRQLKEQTAISFNQTLLDRYIKQ